jgi:hypothetical protein
MELKKLDSSLIYANLLALYSKAPNEIKEKIEEKIEQTKLDSQTIPEQPKAVEEKQTEEPKIVELELEQSKSYEEEKPELKTIKPVEQKAIPPVILNKPEIIKAAEHGIIDIKIVLDPSTEAKGKNKKKLL